MVCLIGYFLLFPDIIDNMFVVLGLKPKLVIRLFDGLPSPPKELERWLKSKAKKKLPTRPQHVCTVILLQRASWLH